MGWLYSAGKRLDAANREKKSGGRKGVEGKERMANKKNSSLTLSLDGITLSRQECKAAWASVNEKYKEETGLVEKQVVLFGRLPSLRTCVT